MGVGKSMKIFTEAMQNSMTNFGFGSKVVTTVMGPFKWDDNLELWVNVNNGFTMPNISMQDMLAYGYGDDSAGPSSGGTDNLLSICYQDITGLTNTATDIYPNVDARTNILPLYTWSPGGSCKGKFYAYSASDLSSLGLIINISLKGDTGETLVATNNASVPVGSGYEITQPIQFGGTVRITLKPTAQVLAAESWPSPYGGTTHSIRLYNYETQTSIGLFSFTLKG